MMTRLAELPPNARMQTHELQLCFLTEDELKKSFACGYHERASHLGRVYVHDITPSKKIDRSNRATDITCDGIIVLSDIPKHLIFRNAENDKRYISNLTFKAYDNDNIIYTGAICLDDIPFKFILTNLDTGKKYIKARLKKMEALDTYMNTHHLVIISESGTEIEIGRFKEWKNTRQTITEPQSFEGDHNVGDNQRQTPLSIDGIKF